MKRIICKLMFAALAASPIATAFGAGAPSLASWEGSYQYSSPVKLAILPGGKFRITMPCQDTRGDALSMVNLAGTATMSTDGWLHLTASQKSQPCPVPARFDYYAVRNGASRFLVDHLQLLGMVNALNAFGVSDASAWTLLRDSAPPAQGAHAVAADARGFLPPPYRAMLRAEPLAGAVARVVNAGSEIINVADPMRAPEMKERFSARVTINRGARQGVFVGMQLYGAGTELRIDRVREDESEASYKWIPPGAGLAPGAALSSRP
jgi:hypothetical protein